MRAHAYYFLAAALFVTGCYEQKEAQVKSVNSTNRATARRTEQTSQFNPPQRAGVVQLHAVTNSISFSNLVALTDTKHALSSAGIFAAAKNLSARDKPALILQIQRTTNHLQKVYLAEALSRFQDDEAASAIIELLREGFTGVNLDNEQEPGLYGGISGVVLALGHTARKSDVAYEFLKEGINPDFWSGLVNWESKIKENLCAGYASLAIQGLGKSGRPEVPQILQELKKRDQIIRTPNPEHSSQRAGGIATAARLHSNALREQSGLPKVDFEEWRQTPEGKEWTDWAQAEIDKFLEYMRSVQPLNSPPTK
jgi:hypothetical protein